MVYDGDNAFRDYKIGDYIRVVDIPIFYRHENQNVIKIGDIARIDNIVYYQKDDGTRHAVGLDVIIVLGNITNKLISVGVRRAEKINFTDE